MAVRPDAQAPKGGAEMADAHERTTAARHLPEIPGPGVTVSEGALVYLRAAVFGRPDKRVMRA